MPRKIVILNGSPRRKGNTSALVSTFTEGAESAGHTVTEFFLDSMDIHGCKGCFGGHSNRECPCIQRDGMDKIYPAVRECDVIVLASPLYYWNMSGQIRIAVDHLFALMSLPEATEILKISRENPKYPPLMNLEDLFHKAKSGRVYGPVCGGKTRKMI